ncbi:SDR family NAD(P)-dependent oxidoreductase [Mycolicibacterium novocastrense]|uniref:SDR family NAD(P)-dependent oxidoreductase n=1 Tax=Mycobacterium sp. 852002-51152_SCH6134967 TaxID=1834096 RepID=UPI000801C98E|nr:SDR family NAD(P)-dependent oxidoreductase [Mycobacterium sp. 852002-51152_SCH6134967]OBF95949.1 retinol dehydrogenase [Mycobacterium sp. 852002-51152_SCH6134967]UUO02201.1 SDR family NAD(P)-dependent oxidoreductase [Mycolicibacterium novocastrense]
MPSVLVTGASRGIGKAIAEHLAARGWQVIAGVRTERDAEAVTALDPDRISAVLLDVTDAGQIAALADVLPVRLDAVVNNAGVVVSGPMETVTTDGWRKQLEINVIGQLAVTRAVLPRMRESRGRIVFISSVNGRLSMPLLGAYAASKFALEAAADALRMELQPWRIPVVVVEPAQTDTDMWRTADTMVVEAEAALSPEHRALYAQHIAGMKKMVPVAQRMAVPTEKVSAVVEEALTARRPRPRYVVGLGPKLQVAVVPRLPTRVRDAVLRRVSGQP